MASYVFYVWWDALLNYLTALSFARPGEDLTDTFWPDFRARHLLDGILEFQKRDRRYGGLKPSRVATLR